MIKKASIIFLLCNLAANISFALDSRTVIDSVVASVDGVPITLSDIEHRLPDKKQLTLRQAADDAQARSILEQLIIEKLLLQEAEAKHISVTDSELDSYVNEVAKRNSMSPAEFESALKAQGNTLSAYRDSVRMDIIKSRLLVQYSRNSVPITNDEITQYLAEHPAIASTSDTVKLEQIFISSELHGEDQTQARLEHITNRLGAGDEFSQLAKELSDGPEARDGGNIGIVSELELGPEIKDAIATLEEGKVSAPVKSIAGVHLFRLVKRFGKKGDSEIKEEVRHILMEEKSKQRNQEYFLSELTKLHTVERKI